jgi:hypothetical protein
MQAGATGIPWSSVRNELNRESSEFIERGNGLWYKKAGADGNPIRATHG